MWNTPNDDAEQHGAAALDQAVTSLFASDHIQKGSCMLQYPSNTCMHHDNARNNASMFSTVTVPSRIHLLDDFCIYMHTAAHQEDVACLCCVT